MASTPSTGIPKQFVNIGLTSGVNKKRDAHQLQNGELLTGDNIVFSAVDGQITKRYGYAPITPSNAAFAGGPFSSIGCRDNIEPLVLGAQSLGRYNTAQNSSTALPTPHTGRLRVSQVGASSGQSAQGFQALPLNTTTATDGARYAMVAWQEQNTSTNTAAAGVIFVGLQDLASGIWVQSPQAFSLVANTVNITDGNNVTYTPFGLFYPKVCYSNGAFYLFAVQGANAGTKYNYSILGWTISPDAWATGFTRTNMRVQICTNATNPSVASNMALLGCDVALVNGRGVCAYTDPTGSLTSVPAIVFSMSGAVYSGAIFSTASFAAIPGMKVACRADGPAATPFLVGTSNSVAVFSGVGSQTFAQAYGSPVAYKPVDIAWRGTQFVWVSYAPSATAMLGAATLFSPRGPSDYSLTVLATPTAPVQSLYMEYLSRLMFAPDGTPMIWLASGGPNTDASTNATYLVEMPPQFVGGSGQAQGTLNSAFSRVVARTNYLSTPHISGGYYNCPCDVVQIPGTQKFVTFLTSTTESTAATYIDYGVVNRTQFDFAPKRGNQILPLPTGGNIVAGPCPLYYDGNTVTEAGFSAAPDYNVASSTLDYATIPGSVTVTGTTIVYGVNPDGSAFVSSGGLTGGPSVITASGKVEYYYVTCFVRRDAYGNVYRSAPSAVLTVPCPNPVRVDTTLNGNIVTFRGLNYASGGPGNGSASGVNVEFYRTAQNAAGTYYFIGQAPLGQTFVDRTPDSNSAAISGNKTITANRTVYTNSGELPNDPPPACHHMTVGESRAYMIPSDNRNVVWYSKQFSPGRTVEWCANLTVSEGLNSGQFTAVQVLDSNVIVFKEDTITYFYGTGPDNTGAGGGFSQFQKIATDVGCIDPGSIAVIPMGIVFRSRRGIELLNRSLQVQTIGDNIQPLVATLPEIVSVVCMPNFTELRFVTSDANSPVLCLDYQNMRWSTFSGVSAKAAVNMLGNYWFVSADGNAVNQETMGGYLDNGKPIVMTLETAEIPVGSAGMQGWGRVYRMALMGDFYTNHQMTLQFAYDHSSTYSDTVVFDTTKGLISGDSVYQFRLSRMPRQTMQSLRIRLQDSNIASLGQACGISNLVLETGSKNGLTHLSAAKTL